MYICDRQKEIVKKALKDYDFIKEELENKIKKGYDLNELSKFLCRFKDIEITNLEIYDDIGYLDFLYNDINTSAIYNADKKTIKVSETMEIYDKVKYEYIVEDFLTKEEYIKMLFKTKEMYFDELVKNLKEKPTSQYYRDEFIRFLNEEWCK